MSQKLLPQTAPDWQSSEQLIEFSFNSQMLLPHSGVPEFSVSGALFAHPTKNTNIEIVQRIRNRVLCAVVEYFTM